MTRILYMSDLHLEMERWKLPIPGWADFEARHRRLAGHPARGPLLDGAGAVDLVVLAGDIHNGYRGVVYADEVARYLGAPVVMVAGNHEFYHHDMATLLPALHAAAAKTGGRVRFLEDAAMTYEFADGALTVLGCTLWTDYALNGTPAESMALAAVRMNDHRFITAGGAKLLPRDTLARHEASRAWLAAALEHAPGRTLVVTHHAPASAFLGTRIGDIAPAYGSELLPAFAGCAPSAWIHGHTHYRHDTQVGHTRVVSAPRGYVGYDGDSALTFQPGILEL